MPQQSEAVNLSLDALIGRIKRSKYILLILTFYFIAHLINLTKLPIYNDESIYLDWAWFHTHVPGHLYDSMLDAKQPLIIWLFGIAERIFPDPLFAGRFTSVILGSLTLIGVYAIAKKLFNEKVALFSAFTFSVIPIFVFYNRQALLEAGVACAAIWSFYALMNFIGKPSNKAASVLGIILGIGFFIKTTGAIYIIISVLLITVVLFKNKTKIEELTKFLLVTLTSLIAVIAIILINPVFWEQLRTNSRYSLTFSEILRFPIMIWLTNIRGYFEISFVFLSPLIFISALAGMVLIIKEKSRKNLIFLTFFLLALVIEIIVTRSQAMRYIMSFLPFMAITASVTFYYLWKINLIGKSIVVICLTSSILLSTFLILEPANYLVQMSKFTKFSDTGYVYGQTSGTGVGEAVEYIKKNASSNTPNMVFIALNIGNPESAIDLYSFKNPNLVTLHIKDTFFPELGKYNCIASEIPVFFVTRNKELAGMERFFEQTTSFKNGDYSVGVYELKKNCKGESFSISEVYREPILQVLETK